VGDRVTISASLIVYILEITGFLLIGLLAILRMRSTLHGTFSLFAFSLGAWQSLQALSILGAGNHVLAMTLLMTSVVFSAIMASSVYLFVSAYTKARMHYWLLAVGAAVGSLAYFSPALRTVSITSQGIGIPQLDLYYGIVLLFDACVLFISIVSLVRFYFRTTSKQERVQTMIILGSVAVGGVITIMASFYTSDFSNSFLAQQVIPITCLAVLMAFLYAMTYRNLFDIKLAAVRTVVYVGSLTVLAIIYYFLAYIVSVTIFQDESDPSVSISPINIALALFLAFLFQPIKAFFDKTTDSIFYRERYNTDDFIARLSEVLTTTTDLRSLLERASREIGTTLKSEQTFFFVQHSETHYITAGTVKHANLPLKDAQKLNEYVKSSESRVLVADLLPSEHPIHRLLVSHRVAILMPLIRGGVILGYLAVGDQRGGGYTSRDIKTLQTLSDELIIAIQNVLSVQEVKDINTHLQQRIDAATAELRRSNTQLRHLDKTKDEFLSMASHQLRTPLTSVKGYLSMVLEGDAGKVNAMQKQLLSEAFTSSERMVHLIHDFLNVSRLQTGKFMLELHPYDIAKLIDEEVVSLQRVAEVRHMKLEFINGVGELVLSIDENKIRQVVMNFIDNALFYSHDNSVITVELLTKDDVVELRVKDTGIGVPKGEQSQLFTKFYRASNARRQRPDGTGVGIFLAKKVVTEHGGDILFESTEGKGSTFGFTLPIAKLQPNLEYKLHDLEQ
jgi:signal transduction histidine kinase